MDRRPTILVAGANEVQWTRVCLALTRAGLAGEFECRRACRDFKRKYALADLDAMSEHDLSCLYSDEFPDHALCGRRDTLIEKLFALPAPADDVPDKAEGEKAPAAA